MSRYIGICTILKGSPRLLEVFDRDTFVFLHDLNLTLTSPGTDHLCEVDWVGGKIKELRPEESDNHIEPIFGGMICSCSFCATLPSPALPFFPARMVPTHCQRTKDSATTKANSDL